MVKKLGTYDIICNSKMVELLENNAKDNKYTFDKFKSILYKYENEWYLIIKKAIALCYVIYKFELKENRLIIKLIKKTTDDLNFVNFFDITLNKLNNITEADLLQPQLKDLMAQELTTIDYNDDYIRKDKILSLILNNNKIFLFKHHNENTIQYQIYDYIKDKSNNKVNINNKIYDITNKTYYKPPYYGYYGQLI